MGNFGAFTFIGTWLNDRFMMTVDQIGSVLLFLGLGNMLGSFFGSSLVQKIGGLRSVLAGIGLSAVIYIMIDFSPSPAFVKLAYFVLFAIAGTIFPVMMSLLQTLSGTARGTTASLTNADMYAATTLGAYWVRQLYAHYNMVIGVYTAVCYVASLYLWMRSESLSSSRQAAEQNLEA